MFVWDLVVSLFKCITSNKKGDLCQTSFMFFFLLFLKKNKILFEL